MVLRQVRRQVQEFDLVITSGGIGPTHDDITIYSVARALNQNVRENKVRYTLSSLSFSREIMVERKRLTNTAVNETEGVMLSNG